MFAPYVKDLVKDLDSELSGDFRQTILALMMPPAEYDCYSLNEAMKGLGSDKTTLIDLICNRSKPELDEIKQVYKRGK